MNDVLFTIYLLKINLNNEFNDEKEFYLCLSFQQVLQSKYHIIQILSTVFFVLFYSLYSHQHVLVNHSQSFVCIALRSLRSHFECFLLPDNPFIRSCCWWTKYVARTMCAWKNHMTNRFSCQIKVVRISLRKTIFSSFLSFKTFPNFEHYIVSIVTSTVFHWMI